MLINKRQLKAMCACSKGFNRYIEQVGFNDRDHDVASLVGGKNYQSDLLWLASNVISKHRLNRLVSDIALINISEVSNELERDHLISMLQSENVKSHTATIEHIVDNLYNLNNPIVILQRQIDCLNYTLTFIESADPEDWGYYLNRIAEMSNHDKINVLLVKLFNGDLNVGDKLLCETSKLGFTKGESYIVGGFDGYGFPCVTDNDGELDINNGVNISEF